MDLSMKMKVTMLVHLAYDKDLFYKREKNLKDPDFKPLPSFAITIKKRKGKTLFIPHKPEEKYLKDHGLCVCKPLKNGYLDDVKLRNLDSVIYSEE